MNDDRPDDLAARLAQVESELARVKFDVPMTEAEMVELMNAPQGESIISIIEEFETKYRDSL